MTGGSESGFGSGGGPPVPADPSEDESAFRDSEIEESGSVAPIGGESLDSTVDDIEIPRQSIPFRKWNAAYGYGDSGPSLWERFRAWLVGLFRRKRDVDDRDQGEEDRDQGEYGAMASLSDEYGTSAPMSRPSFDDLDAPWGEPHPVAEVASPRKSGELPHPDDFEAPWDDPYAGQSDSAAGSEVSEPAPSIHPPIHQSTTPPLPSGDADPLWDEPRVAASATTPAEAISRGDLDFVWSPPGPDEDVDLLAEARAAAASDEASAGATSRPKRLSFISRLFGRKKKEEQTAIVSDSNAAVEEERADTRQPAVDDFADSETTDAIGASDTVDEFAAAEITGVGTDELSRGEHAVAQAAGDFDVDVKVDADSEVGVDADLEEEVESPPSPKPKRPSLIARLFRRKPREAPPVASEIEAAIADLDVIEAKLEPMVEALETEPESEAEVADRPSDALDDEPTIRAARRHSLAHSAEDAAQLADFLASSYVAPVAPDAAPPIAASFAEPSVEPPFIEPSPEPQEESLDEAPSIEAEVQLGEEVSTFEPDLEVVPEPEPEPKKPGFFSRLIWRKSQVKPPVAQPVEPPIEELAATTDASDEPAHDLSATAEVEEEILAAEEPDLARWARPAVDDSVSETAPPVDLPELESEPVVTPQRPTPFFVDARDDFDEPVAVAEPSSESGRTTEAFEQPVVDEFAEGDKTDEFEVVPGVPESAAEEAEEAPGFIGRLFGRKKAATGKPAAPGGAPGSTVIEALDVEGKAPFVLAKFRMFYNEVIRDKHQKSEVISGFATAIVSAAAADLANPDFAAQLLSERLKQMLDLQAAESNWTGGDAVKYYPEAQYAMVALADETFLTHDWPGKPSWHKHMLEPKLYGTRGADLEFFARVDKLLRDPDPPQGARDLARVYLLVIASGFRGKFRVPGLKRPLAEYRRRLYEFSHGTDPLELYARDRTVFPEASSRTLASRAVGRFTSAQKWAAAVVILAVLYATVSYFAWTKLSADLTDVMSRVESSTNPGGPAR